MTSYKSIIVALCFLGSFIFSNIQLVDAQAPIPVPGYDGWKLGDASKASILFEIYVDMACDDTAVFFNQVFPKIYHYYFNSTNISSPSSIPIGARESSAGDLYLIIHQFPLPYHISAFDMSMVSRLILDKQPSQYLPFLLNTFANQQFISNNYLAKMSRNDYRDMIYAKFVQPFGVTKSIYDNEMNGYTLWNKARISFKYATTRSVYGTPSFMVNGVLVPDTPSDFDGWKKLFDSLIGSN